MSLRSFRPPCYPPTLLFVGLFMAPAIRSRGRTAPAARFRSHIFCSLIGQLAVLLDAPWIFFLCCGYVAAALQGVAHELTGQRGTLNQLHNAAEELAHTSFFPLLTLQVGRGWPSLLPSLRHKGLL